MKNQFKTLGDDELLKNIASGDRQAFTALFHRYWEEMYRSAYFVTRDREISMDVIQEVFVWMWENRESWTISNTKSYLQAAVKYKVANEIRKGKLRSVAFEGWKDRVNSRQMVDNWELEVKELQRIIRDFTGQLPPRCQEIFRLSRFEHMSNREIADRLNISEKTVENQITIALGRLRRHLGHLAFWLIFFL